jgi:hypothetical protein
MRNRLRLFKRRNVCEGNMDEKHSHPSHSTHEQIRRYPEKKNSSFILRRDLPPQDP